MSTSWSVDHRAHHRCQGARRATKSHCPGTHPASGIVMYSPPGPAGRRYDQRAAIKSLQDGGALAAPDALGQPRAASRRARLATVPATPAACQQPGHVSGAGVVSARHQ